MSKLELISPEGLRLDGRRPNELRAFEGRLGVVGPGVDGSAQFCLGGTRVVATVSGPKEAVERAALAADPDRGVLSVRFHSAAFSSAGGERRARGTDRRLLEWARLVEGAFQAAVMLEAFPRSEVEVFVEVLHADGAVLAAAINAVNLALVDAGVPMLDYVVATNAALVQNTLLMDANRMEEGVGAGTRPVLTAAFLPRTGRLVMGVSEPRLPADQLARLLDLAQAGSGKIFEHLDAHAVRPYLLGLYREKHAAMASGSGGVANKDQ